MLAIPRKSVSYYVNNALPLIIMKQYYFINWDTLLNNMRSLQRKK